MPNARDRLMKQRHWPEPVNDITVVRLGHRKERDKRITSHLGLTARALGADHFVLAGEADENVLTTMREVTQNFGGDFTAEHVTGPMGWLKRFAREEDGIIVHLTMYGEPHDEVAAALPADRPVAIVVGGAKVPGEMYKIATHNVGVGNQPHSEVAALAIFMAAWKGGVAPPEHFTGARLEVQPSARGKVVIDRSED